MNTRYLIIGLMSGILLLEGCDKNEYGAPEKSKYIYDIPQTELSSDAVVGAYYTGYTEPVNEATSPEKPELGYYTTTAQVMSQHVVWADEAGLDFFIFPYDAAENDANMLAMFSSSRQGANVKAVVCYNTSHLGLTNEEPLESDGKYKNFLADFIDVLAPVMMSDDYYCIDGRPVMLITPANLSSSTSLSIDFYEVIDRFKSDFASFYGVEPYIVGEMTTGWVAPVNYSDHQVYSFDGLVLKDWKTRSYDIFYGYFSFLDINMNNWKTTLARRNVDFIPCIFPSYNDRKASASSYYYTFSEDGDPADYVNFCNVAKRNIGSRNMVFLNSWNGWSNGTNLEPSDLKGERFLEVTRSQFKKN
ncbi:MAG: glycoside hydrolase family 99-like domain-containing protein [Bacteroidetes bacterium]|uniref:Glycoside hydrolase family 99-like domain-containing protein n=1 Tax=Candidatus Cryptobacteroides faecigallinarum TaxID=2840763 RepID=A0A9D9IML1_9BACT|nr:glycoside hydrolase family 99-like domain-containing protein [Candidatus Cryptobacteroides faecigallinarum]